MICNNEVSYMVEIGNSMRYREQMVRCGTTDPEGDLCVCDECWDNKDKRASIERQQATAKADNEWLISAGWGEM